MIQIRKNKIIFILITTLIIVVAWYFLAGEQVSKPNSSLPQTAVMPIQMPINQDEYVGMISVGKDGQSVYTSNKYNFQFIYPQGWRVGDNHLGYGMFQLFNYDASDAVGKSVFPQGHSKIEALISTDDSYKSSTDYPEKGRVIRKVVVAGQPATRFEIELIGGEKILSYIVLLPGDSGKYLSIHMYGDSSNFHTLDEIIESLVWIPK